LNAALTRSEIIESKTVGRAVVDFHPELIR